MDNAEKLLGLNDFKILSINARSKQKVIINIESKNKKQLCVKCNKYTESINNKYYQLIKDDKISGKSVFLRIKKKVFICHRCNNVFVERIESLLYKRKYTKRYSKTIFEDCLESTITRVSKKHNLSYNCVESIYNDIAVKFIEHLKKYMGDIEILGIDEISIKKGHKDYQAVISNIGGGYVIDVLPDRKKDTVVKFLQEMPKKAQKRIVFVSIDMWDGYFNAAREVLPGTTIVIDRFHVMSNLNKAITACRRNIQKKLPKELKDKYKGYRWTILKNEENMTEEDLKRIKKMSKECPELDRLYKLKLDFQNIFDHTIKASRADVKLKKWENKVHKLYDDNMNKFLNTLPNWREWILNYFVSKKVTNAFVEGMNNKIKLVKRIGYGYRNKINFRRKVLIECGYNNLPKSYKSIFLL